MKYKITISSVIILMQGNTSIYRACDTFLILSSPITLIVADVDARLSLQ